MTTNEEIDDFDLREPRHITRSFIKRYFEEQDALISSTAVTIDESSFHSISRAPPKYIETNAEKLAKINKTVAELANFCSKFGVQAMSDIAICGGKDDYEQYEAMLSLQGEFFVGKDRPTFFSRGCYYNELEAEVNAIRQAISYFKVMEMGGPEAVIGTSMSGLCSQVEKMELVEESPVPTRPNSPVEIAASDAEPGSPMEIASSHAEPNSPMEISSSDAEDGQISCRWNNK